MINMLEILQKRHSVRKYTGEPISDQSLMTILQAGLLSPSSRAIRPWEFIVVREKDTLQKMANCRVNSAKMLEHAEAAVVVIGHAASSDVWIEDCAVAMSNMHLMADSIGLGSCWIQGRLRETPSGESTEQYIRKLLHFPMDYQLEAILSLGMPECHADKTEIASLHTEKIHWESF